MISVLTRLTHKVWPQHKTHPSSAWMFFRMDGKCPTSGCILIGKRKQKARMRLSNHHVLLVSGIKALLETFGFDCHEREENALRSCKQLSIRTSRSRFSLIAPGSHATSVAIVRLSSNHRNELQKERLDNRSLPFGFVH